MQKYKYLLVTVAIFLLIILIRDKMENINSFLGIKNSLVISKNTPKTFPSKEEALTDAKITEGSELVYKKDDKWCVSEVKQKNLFSEKSISKKDNFNLDEKELSKMGIKDPILSFVEDKLSLDDKSLSPEFIRKTYKTASYDQLKEIAANINTPPDILKELAGKVEYIKVKVAGNPSTPKDVLAELANDSSRYVRGEVAANVSTPKDISEKLSNDPIAFVRDKTNQNF